MCWEYLTYLDGGIKSSVLQEFWHSPLITQNVIAHKSSSLILVVWNSDWDVADCYKKGKNSWDILLKFNSLLVLDVGELL